MSQVDAGRRTSSPKSLHGDVDPDPSRCSTTSNRATASFVDFAHPCRRTPTSICVDRLDRNAFEYRGRRFPSPAPTATLSSSMPIFRTASDVAIILLGALMIALALVDAFKVVLLPRATRERSRFVRLFFRFSWRIWGRMARLITNARHRDNMLAVYGPLSMVALFASWIVLLVVGFGLIHWVAAADKAQGPDGFASAILFSADMFFTVGSVVSEMQGTVTHTFGVIEAGVGFAFIALTIGYLPVLYSSFSSREAYLIRFQVRSAPDWTTSDVLRFFGGAHGDLIETWLREAETWIANLMVSHNSYPMLAFYRSQREDPSWLACVAVILDTCAVLCAAGVGRLQPDATAAVGISFLTDLNISLGIEARSIAPRDHLSGAAVSSLLSEIRAPSSNFTEIAQRVEALRSRYEPELCRLSEYLMLPLPTLVSPKVEN